MDEETRLFVDVDDTLVIYEDATRPTHHLGGLAGIPWRANDQIVQGIRAFRAQHRNALIVVWSGGGRQYSATWIDRLVPGMGVVAMSKVKEVFGLMRPGDIVVDDQAQSLGTPAGVRVLGPNEWPEAMTPER